MKEHLHLAIDIGNIGNSIFHGRYHCLDICMRNAKHSIFHEEIMVLIYSLGKYWQYQYHIGSKTNAYIFMCEM